MEWSGVALDGRERRNFERGIDGNYTTSFAEILVEQFEAGGRFIW